MFGINYMAHKFPIKHIYVWRLQPTYLICVPLTNVYYTYKQISP